MGYSRYLLCIYQSDCQCFSYRSDCFFLCSSVCKNTSFHQLSVRCILCVGQCTSGNGSRNSSTAYQHEPSGNHFYSCIIYFADCYWNDRTCMGTTSCRCIVYSDCSYIVRKNYEENADAIKRKYAYHMLRIYLFQF